MQQARECASYLNIRVDRTTLTPFTDRVQRLKDARAEANKEIQEYKKSKEEEYKKFEGDVRRFNTDPCAIG